MSIRPAKSSDIRHIMRIERRCFHNLGITETKRTMLQRMAVNGGGFLVHEKDDAVVGYSCCYRVHEVVDPPLNEETSLFHVPSGTVYYIAKLGVDPAHQGRGIGTALLHQHMKRARTLGCTKIYVKTSTAMQFYEPHGFFVIQEKCDDMGDREYVLMLKDLGKDL